MISAFQADDPGSIPGRRISKNKMSEQEQSEIREVSKKQKLTTWYNKNYKLLLIIPIFLFLFSLAYLGYSFYTTGDFITKDITLTGGTSVTLFSEQEINTKEISDFLSGKINDLSVRELSDFRTGRQKAVIIETISEPNQVRDLLEEFLKYELTSENSSIESTGSSLGKSFYNQLRIAILISFILMAIIVFILFRNFIPSFAVVISAFADITMTLAFVDLIGMKISSAGITAILMLIGYSVDSDIMLTTRLLKRQGETNKNLLSAFKTGITMTLTSIIAITLALFIIQSFSNILEQIFSILIIGLTFDILNTWITNVSILKWYLESKHHD